MRSAMACLPLRLRCSSSRSVFHIRPHTAEEPHPAGESLRHVLLALWPSFFAFALSFFIILVSWMTHHELIRLVRATNNAVMLANGTVLAYVTFLPFSTTVLATHLGGPETPMAVAQAA